jgi:tripartite-type tricarboxylate transporter receptor subunit TctC
MKKYLACALLALPMWAATNAAAQPAAYPSKPIRWIVPYAAGGGSDFLARTIGQTLSTQVGQPVLVDNKPGGNTALGAAETARAPADGRRTTARWSSTRRSTSR